MNFYETKNIATFGVAGNFTGHLEQAGEAADFINLKVQDKSAPKGVFPTFLPDCSSSDISKNSRITPVFLHEFPFDSSKIIFPKNEEKLQIEPECGVVFDLKWSENQIINLKPLVFGASNDCSIRKQGAKKISEKKNWGACSKGLAQNLIPLDGFSSKSNINDYRIASFLVREGKIFEYGEDSEIKNYSYIYENLISWLLEKLNNQKDEGPLENIHNYLLESGKPKNIMVSIGATRYTSWGEKNYLQNHDETIVIVYPQSIYSKEQIIKMIENNNLNDKKISVLRQKICSE